MWRFQSTPPRGWRLGVLAVHVLSTRISIHSTTRVETIIFNVVSKHIKFQSTPPRGWRQPDLAAFPPVLRFQSTPPRGWRLYSGNRFASARVFQSTPPRGWRQQYYTITTTILQHISTNKSYPTPSNHGQPSLHTRKSVLIVQIFRCESPRKSMFASGSHQNTLYRFTARGQVRISAVLPH